LAGIQYPGRENRLPEPVLEDMNELATGIASAVRPLCQGTLAIFGHSMGAAVAYEVSLRLNNPAVLFVSGCGPPQSYQGRTRKTWSDSSILSDLKRLGGPNQAIFENSALLSLALPALRADYFLVENYVPSTGAKLTCPVVAFCGDQDEEVSLDQMKQWSAVTTGSFRLSVFRGNHFFPLHGKQDVTAEIISILAEL
jgi:surfactin synthase thioesterase subunit